MTDTSMAASGNSQRDGLIGLFSNHPVAANLLMVVCLVGGVIATFTMRQEVFPNALLDTIEINVQYRGATASEVETQVVQPIEQSIDTLRDIRTVVSEIQAGGASIFVMLDSTADAQRTLDEIRGACSSPDPGPDASCGYGNGIGGLGTQPYVC